MKEEMSQFYEQARKQLQDQMTQFQNFLQATKEPQKETLKEENQPKQSQVVEKPPVELEIVIEEEKQQPNLEPKDSNEEKPNTGTMSDSQTNQVVSIHP